MNPLALFFLVLTVGVAPFALFDFRFNGLDLLAVMSLIASIAIQILRPRKAHR